MAELEKIESVDKFGDFQKKYNLATKGVARMLGTNVALYVCILLPILLIGFIWTDFGLPTFGIKFVSEGIVTVTLFVIGETMMSKIGADGGKLDPEYIDARKELKSLVDSVHKIGTSFISIFCDWQIDMELDRAVTSRLRSLHLSREEWEKLKELPKRELKKKYGKKKAKEILAISNLQPIELNEYVLLFDSEDNLGRGGVPISGEGYLYKKTHSLSAIPRVVFTGLITVSFAITLTSDISWARVVYTAVKLVLLLYRMACGYNMGAKAYNRIEVGRIQATCNYLRQYICFVEEKTYNLLGDKYGSVVQNDENGANRVQENVETNVVAVEAQ